MGIRNPNKYQIPEFSSFNRFVTEWLPNQDPRKLDFVFRPQSEFLIDEDGQLMVDHVGRLERLNETIGRVEQELGVDVILAERNQTADPGDYRDAYDSQEIVDIVGQRYRQDIELFKYEF